RLLDLSTTKSDRKGVLTWVLSQEGALVRRGDVIARIADLSSFRVDGSVSDVHAGQLRPGMSAVVRINDESLDGTISEVFPTVEYPQFSPCDTGMHFVLVLLVAISYAAGDDAGAPEAIATRGEVGGGWGSPRA